MDPTQEEEDRRAREELDAQLHALDDLGSQTAAALAPVTGGEPERRTVDLGMEDDPETRFSVPGDASQLADENTDDFTDPETGTAAGIHPMEGEDSVSPLEEPSVEAVTPPAPAAPEVPSAFAAPKPPADAAREAEAGPLPTLDEGLPTEGDISQARDLDSVRRAFHALGSGFTAASGRSPRPFESQADPLVEERRRGLREALQRKGVLAREDATAQRQEARQAVQDERAERQLAQGERRLDLLEQSTGARTEQVQAQTEHTRLADELARASREDRQDPTSGISSGFRDAIRARVGLMPDADVVRMAQDFPDLRNLDAMSAEQLEPIYRAMTTGVGVRLGRPGAGQGGGGGDRDAIVAEMVRRGIVDSPEEAQSTVQAIGQRGARAAIQQSLSPTARARGQDEEGLEVLPGVRARLADPIEARQIRHGFAQGRTQYASLGEVARIADRFGTTGPISPEAAAELGGPLSRLRAMVATLQNTGIINPSEAPAIEAMLPDPRSVSQMTFQTLQGRLDSFRRELNSSISSELEARGVDEAGIREALRQFHGGVGSGRASSSTSSASQPAAPRGGPGTSRPVRVQRIVDGAPGPRGWVSQAFLDAHPGEYEVIDGP